MVQATNLGYPRIGLKRELKKALEQFWSGKLSEVDLQARASELRRAHWQLQRQAGLTHIPSNDFSLYDHVLDTIALVGAVPARYGWQGEQVDLATYFAMARGVPGQQAAVPAMEMTKWFDTNYHYIVPEFTADQQFRLASTKPVEQFREAQALSIHTRPVLLGPVSFLLLGKMHQSHGQTLELLERLLPVYGSVLSALAEAGADWVQIDEPCLVLDLPPAACQAFEVAYAQLRASSPQLRLLLTTYFGDLRENLDLALHLPIAGLHLDLVRAPEQLARALPSVPASLTLSLGVVDGRNVWRTDLEQALHLITPAIAALGSERVLIGPSCSLLHTSMDLRQEHTLDDELQSWLAFAYQKLEEIAVLTRALNDGAESVAAELQENRLAFERRRSSPRIHNTAVAQRLAAIQGQEAHRQNAYAERHIKQQEQLHLPLLPTTTTGSFPQTAEVRAARAAYKSGKLDEAAYTSFMQEEIAHAIRFQEEIGLDVLVHGECERSDMVEYFGEQLSGMVITQHAWVQSYGSRCVRPPIIYGDVWRDRPMTVQWTTYAQSLTTRPVKGMLTGPVTILQWSFVRDDQPREQTCRQIALAIHDEVLDLEAAGITIIQIDEPALREGLPLHRADWQSYLTWAVNCFRQTASSARNETQIHTHMCYSEFDDIIAEIGKMDADVLSIEASRSQLELLDTFVTYRYPNEIGPGVYDIHSPRVPSQQEMEAILRKALQVLPPRQLWVNPDCGLKTRRWEEMRPALANMVQAAHAVRTTVAK